MPLAPPLWELGHVAWFQEFWIGRNQQREFGIHYDANHVRLPSLLVQADSWYNSCTVAHEARWHLPLLGPMACKDYLAKTLQQTLALLAQADERDDALYFFRWALFHEDMHAEAWVQMGQALGIELPETPPPPSCSPAAALLVDADEQADRAAVAVGRGGVERVGLAHDRAVIAGRVRHLDFERIAAGQRHPRQAPGVRPNGCRCRRPCGSVVQ